MTHPPLTDGAVADLPLSQARADLLEEIIASAGVSELDAHRRPARWLAPLAAAAVVATVVGGLTVAPWRSDTAGSDGSRSVASAGGDAYLLALDAPGWRVENAADGGLGISYRSGAATVEIDSRPASLYADYVKDREHISAPAGPGEPVALLGRPGQLWAYGPDDHTVIRAPEHGYSFEIRGQGLDRAAYLAMLDRLRLVDLHDFEAALPPRFLSAVERAPAVRSMLDGIVAQLGPARGLSPSGTSEPAIDSQNSDPYSLGAEVAGTVACSWLRSYTEGRASGDADRVDDAVAALATSKRWPVLLAMQKRGDYSAVVWGYADDAAAGRDVSGYPSGLGCP